MAKKPEEYAPSPWLREDLKAEHVRLPPAIVGALYRLQKDTQEIEYGGAIDFELVKGNPAVEKVLAYTGIRRAIPGETWLKVFQGPEVELTFHTHPKQDLAIPSEGDIIFFLTTPQKSMLIFAGVQAMLMMKGPETPPDDYCRQHMKYVESEATKVSVPGYNPKTAPKEQDQMIRDLKEELDIDSIVFPAKEPIDITLKVVREAVRREPA